MQNIRLMLAFTILIMANSIFSQDVKQTDYSKHPTKETSMETENKQIIRSLYENMLNQRHMELLPTIIDDNYIGVRGEKGAEGLKQTVSVLIESFPDIQWHIEELLADGNKVIVRWKWTGTFQHAFRGFAPNQKQFTNEAIAIYELSDKKVIKAWLQSDQLGFLMQADVVSPNVLSGSKK